MVIVTTQYVDQIVTAEFVNTKEDNCRSRWRDTAMDTNHHMSIRWRQIATMQAFVRAGSLSVQSKATITGKVIKDRHTYHMTIDWTAVKISGHCGCKNVSITSQFFPKSPYRCQSRHTDNIHH